MDMASEPCISCFPNKLHKSPVDRNVVLSACSIMVLTLLADSVILNVSWSILKIGIYR